MDNRRGFPLSPCQSQNRLQPAQARIALHPAGRSCPLFPAGNQRLSHKPSAACLPSLAPHSQGRNSTVIQARHLPPDAYVDHPVDHLEPEQSNASAPSLLAREALRHFFDWGMRGSVEQRSLRLHIVALHVCPQFLPCKRPTVSWCARIHGVSRQWATRLHQEFIQKFGLEQRRRRTRSQQRRTPRPLRHSTASVAQSVDLYSI